MKKIYCWADYMTTIWQDRALGMLLFIKHLPIFPIPSELKVTQVVREPIYEPEREVKYKIFKHFKTIMTLHI